MNVLWIAAVVVWTVSAATPDRSPIIFEPNVGQTSSEISFVCRGGGHTWFLASSSAAAKIGDTVLRTTFLHSNPAAGAEGLDRLDGVAHYLTGDQPENWRRGVARFARVRFQEVYPGIDIVYYGHNGNLEYDFVVKPWADPAPIAIRIEGSDETLTSAGGDLRITTGPVEIRDTNPAFYQIRGGVRRSVVGRLMLRGRNEVLFEVRNYDRSLSLTIDPSILYSTYLGGSGQDSATSIAVDSAGNTYLAGWTESTDFPTQPGYRVGLGKGVDVYVAKFRPDGKLVYTTYLGGSGEDRAFGLAIDASGCVVVTGWTYSTNFPLLNAMQTRLAGGRDAFVAKLNSGGTALVFSTYLGGTGNDSGNATAVDQQGNVYISGDTASSEFPVFNGFQPQLGGGQDSFIAKFTASGARVYSTYLGGRGDDRATAIAVDLLGNAYVTGSTYSPNFPVVNAFQASIGGGQDAFAAKLSAAGNVLLYSTYIGGAGGSFSAQESGSGIAVDGLGAAFIVGNTSSQNFPVYNAVQSTAGGGEDSFVLKLNVAGNALVYSTYLGGSSVDCATGVAIDSSGIAYVSGYTASEDFPVASAIRSSNAGGYDGFVAMLRPDGGGILISTYLGGSGSDSVNAIAVDSVRQVYVAGQTLSTDFPVTGGVQTFPVSTASAFSAKIVQASSGMPSVVSGTPVSVNGTSQTFTFTGQDADGVGDIGTMYFLVNATASVPQNSCHGFYVRAQNALYLYNDALTAAQGPLTPGTSGTLQNRQCIVYGSSSSLVSASGTNLVVNIGLGLQGSYAGTNKNVYLWVKDNEGHDTGWVQTSTWNLAAAATNPPSVVSGAPTISTTSPQTFTFTGQDADGATDIGVMYFLVNSSASIPQNTCHGLYVRAQNALYLYNDALTAVQGPLTLGTSGTLQNSQCIVYESSSSLVSASGTNLVVSIGLGLQGSYAGTNKNVYLWVKDNEGHDTGWVQTGTWNLVVAATNPPSVVSGAPASSTTSPQTFTFTGQDADGATDIGVMYFLVNSNASVPQNTCHGFYLRAQNALYLYNDALTAVQGPLTPGTAGTLQNSQCVVYGSSSSLVSGSGTSLIVNIGLGLQGSYAGTNKNVYLWVKDNEGHDTGWVQASTWNLGATSTHPPSVVSGTPTGSTTSPQTFTFTGQDADGAMDIGVMYFLVNASASVPQNTCHGFYLPTQNALYLYNDALTAAQGPLTPGTAGTLQNSQCVVYGNSSSLVSASGANLVVNIGLGLQGSYAGTQMNVYLWLKDNEGHDTGWVQTSTWNLASAAAHPPSVVSGTPTSSTTSPQTFTFTGQDLDGATDIGVMYFLVNSSASVPQNTCHGFYLRAQNALYLYNDALTAVQGPLTPGTAGTLQNSQCVVYGSSSSLVSASGKNLIVNIGLGLQGSYAGTNKNVYLWVKDNEGHDTGWVQTGIWKIGLSY